MKDIMIDIESEGLKADCKILRIAAVAFDMNETDVIYDKRITQESQPNRSVDFSTQQFWKNQPYGTVWQSFSDPNCSTLQLALTVLSHRINELRDGFRNERCTFWSWRPFDYIVLNNAYDQLSYMPPWQYNEIADASTIRALGIGEHFERKLDAHIAVNDCLEQIEFVREAWRRLA